MALVFLSFGVSRTMLLLPQCNHGFFHVGLYLHVVVAETSSGGRVSLLFYWFLVVPLFSLSEFCQGLNCSLIELLSLFGPVVIAIFTWKGPLIVEGRTGEHRRVLFNPSLVLGLSTAISFCSSHLMNYKKKITNDSLNYKGK